MITLEDIQELRAKELITPEQARDIARTYGIEFIPLPKPEEAIILPVKQVSPPELSSVKKETSLVIRKQPIPVKSQGTKTISQISKKQVNYLAIIFASLGGALTIGGIMTLAVTYWGDIPSWIKLLGGILVMYAFWGVGFFLHEVRRSALKTGYACCMVGACMWGACNKLFSYLYHVSTVPSSGVLSFLLGILPFPWIIRLRGLFLLLIASCFLWAGLVIHENPDTPAAYFLIPVLAVACAGLGWLLGQPRVAGGVYKLYAPLASICGTWFFAVGFPLSVFNTPEWTFWNIVCILVPCLQFSWATLRKNVSVQAAALLSLLIFIILSFKNNLPEQSGVPIFLHLLLICLPLAMGLFIRLFQVEPDRDIQKLILGGICLGAVAAMTAASLQFQWGNNSPYLSEVSGLRFPSFTLEHTVSFSRLLQYLSLWIFPVIMLKRGGGKDLFPVYAQGISFVFVLLTLLSPSLEMDSMPTGSFGILALLLLVCTVITRFSKPLLPLQVLAAAAYILCSQALAGPRLSGQHIVLLILPAFAIGAASLWKRNDLATKGNTIIQGIRCFALALVSLDIINLVSGTSTIITQPPHLLIILFLAIPLLPFLVNLVHEIRYKGRETRASRFMNWSFPLLFTALYLCLLFGQQTASQLLVLVCWALLIVQHSLLDNSGKEAPLSPAGFLKKRILHPLSSRKSIGWPLILMGSTSTGILLAGIGRNPMPAVTLIVFTLLPLGMCTSMAFYKSPIKSSLGKTIPGIVTTVFIAITACTQILVTLSLADIGSSRPDILLCLWGITLSLAWFFRNRSSWNWCIVGLAAQIGLIFLPVTIIVCILIALCIPVFCAIRPLEKYTHLPVIFLTLLLLGQTDYAEPFLLIGLFPVTALYLAGQPSSIREKYLPILLFLFFIVGILLVPGMNDYVVQSNPTLSLITACSIPVLWILRIAVNSLYRRSERPDAISILQYVSFAAGFIFLLLKMPGYFLIFTGIFTLAAAGRIFICKDIPKEGILLPITSSVLAFILLEYLNKFDVYTIELPALFCALSFLSYGVLTRQKYIFPISLFLIQFILLQSTLLQSWNHPKSILDNQLWIALLPVLIPVILFTAHAIRQGAGNIRSWGNMAYLLPIPLFFLLKQPFHNQEYWYPSCQILLGVWFAGIVLSTLRDGRNRSLFNAFFSSLAMMHFMGANVPSALIGFSLLMVSFCIAKNRKLSSSAIFFLGLCFFLAQLCCYKAINGEGSFHLSSFVIACLPGLILLIQLKKWVLRLGLPLTFLFSLAMITIASVVPVLYPFGVMIVLVFCGAVSVLCGLRLGNSSIINCGVILIALVAASLAINLLDSVSQKGLGLLICGLTLLGLAYVTERTRRALISRMHQFEHKQPS